MAQRNSTVRLIGSEDRVRAFLEAAARALANPQGPEEDALARALRGATLLDDGALVSIEHPGTPETASRLERSAKAWELGVELDETNERFFSVLVTRDRTESARIPVRARDAEQAKAWATSSEAEDQFGHRFESDEPSVNSWARPYLGDPDNAAQAIGRDDYEQMTISAIGAEVPQDLNKTLWLQVHCENDIDGPAWASYELSASRLKTMLRLQSLCNEHGLSECRVCDGPAWQHEEGWSITLEELVVTSESFWLVGLPEASGQYFTEALPISELLARLDCEGDIYYPESVREEVEEKLDQGQDAPPPAPAP